MVHEEMRASCSAKELAAHQAYDRLLTNYMAAIDLTLTADQIPPKNLLVEVRPLKDLGDVQTERGSVHLAPNTVHLLRRTDAEMLIRQGSLQQLSKQ